MSDATQNGNEITGRLQFYFDTQVAGPHKTKRLAQMFGCSPDMAKLLKRGEGWTLARLEQARRVFGPSFMEFVFGPLTGQGELHAVTRELAALRSDVTALKASLAGGPFGGGGFRMARDDSDPRIVHAADLGCGEAGRAEAETGGEVKRAAE